MQQLLDHHLQSDAYSKGILDPYQMRLAQIEQIIETDAAKEDVPDCQITLLYKKLNKCSKFNNLHACLPVAAGTIISH